MKKTIFFLLIFIGFFSTAFQQSATAQETKKEEKKFKNTVHFNVTNPIIFGGRSLVFGYERVLNKSRSFTINVGTTGFPTFGIINSDSIQLNTIRDQNGFNISADYRFYLAKENKYEAPRGIYIGPYYSYNYFEKKNSWRVKSTAGGSPLTVESKTSLSVNTIGFEMGYQFIFWDRVTLDMILLGPGIAAYKFKAALGTNLTQADKEKLFDKINDALAEKFPGYGFVVDEGNFKKTGAEKTTSFGYRYMIQVGFRF